MVKNKYKVVIIGAGPAGLATALNLIKCGVTDILVIEKHIFPRYKCCAGYITAKTKKAYEELGLNADDCHYSLIKDFQILYKFRSRLKIDNKFLFTNRYIDRVELDDKFFRLATEQGIAVLEGVKITGHDIEKTRSRFLTEAKSVTKILFCGRNVRIRQQIPKEQKEKYRYAVDL